MPNFAIKALQTDNPDEGRLQITAPGYEPVEAVGAEVREVLF